MKIKKNIAYRVVSFLVLCFSAIFLPFWVTVLVFAFLVLFFDTFIEGFIPFIFIDAIYGVSQERFFNIIFISTIIALLVFLVVSFLKTKIRFNSI